MQFFLDSADLDEIQTMAQTGYIDGVTTNPTLIAAQGKSMRDQLIAIRGLFGGIIHAEVTQNKKQGMEAEAKMLLNADRDLVIKAPATEDGIALIRELSTQKIATNCTLIYTYAHACMAAEAGASYVSPFVGRMIDAGREGIQFITDLAHIFQKNGYSTKILAASIRTKEQYEQVICAGADCITAPYSVYQSIFSDPLLKAGLEKFQESAKSFDI